MWVLPWQTQAETWHGEKVKKFGRMACERQSCGNERQKCGSTPSHTPQTDRNSYLGLTVLEHTSIDISIMEGHIFPGFIGYFPLVFI
jgi:hypothetical protein